MTTEIQMSRKSLLLCALFAVVLVIALGGMAVYVLSDKDLKRAYEFASTALKINEFYSGNVDHDRLITSARGAMFEGLDRYSGYIEADAFSRMTEELSGGYSGIGVTVIRHDRGLLIMDVREKGPAAEAGLLAGDIIISADSIDLGGLDSQESINNLRGEEGEPVKVGVYRPETLETLSVEITRNRVPLLHIPYAGMTSDSIAYVRLLDFEAGASEDLEDAVDSLIENFSPRGLILDLTGNPGGLFAEAYKTANLFLEEGQMIVGTDSRSRWDEDRFNSSGDDITDGLPMVVLVDGGSASSAEIVSGALKQLNRATLVGDTTYGKGLVQGFTRFQDGSGLRLTISRYYLEGGLYLNQFDSTLNDVGAGIPPDEYFELPEYRPFARALENSLLLHQFAHANQDEIVASAMEKEPLVDWVASFVEYAYENEFFFESSETEQAELIHDLAVLDGSDRVVVEATKSLLAIAHGDDMTQFDRHRDYVKRRLEQLAFERKFGLYRAYSEIIVPSRPDIQFAARLLRESTGD